MFSHAVRSRDEQLALLKTFDLDAEYGPCTGAWDAPAMCDVLRRNLTPSKHPTDITRLERWERAQNDGLNPSPEIRDLLLAHAGETEFEQKCVVVVVGVF